MIPEGFRKVSCPFCEGGIEYPLHATGTEIACPHCGKEIELAPAIVLKRESNRNSKVVLKTVAWILGGVIVLAICKIGWDMVEQNLDASGPAMVSIVLALLALAAYFLPTLIANARKHRNTDGILLLNLFLGWTIIGWVAALIWSVYVEKPVTK